MHHRTTHVRLNSHSELQNALFETMTDGVMVVDRHGIIIDCNRAFHQRLGYSKDELLGMPVTELDPPEYATRVAERLAQIHREGQATFETAHYHKDGGIMPVELNARYVEICGEAVFFSIVRDITERKKLEARLKESHEIYQTAINTSTLGFLVTDADGRLIDVNDTYVALSGYSRDELVGMSLPELNAQGGPETTAARIAEVIRIGDARFRSLHRRSDGTVYPVEVTATFSKIQGGRFFVFVEDISAKIQQEQRLELASRLFETIDQAVLVTDAQNRIISINPAVTQITGYTLDELLGKDPGIFSSGRHGKAYFRKLWDSLNRTGHWEGEMWDRRKDGVIYAKWLTINALRDDQGNITQYVSVFSDITERKKNEELIWRQANFDLLTGLPNRHLMHERLDHELKKAHRTNQRLAVLFIDLDRFKEVNDNFGHAKGDALLVLAARRICSAVRETDTIARLGGDEFTIILPDFGTLSNLERIAQTLIEVLSEPYELGNEETGFVSASIGITLFPDDAVDIQGLLKQADQAMYAAKAEGRCRFSYYTLSMQEQTHEKQRLTADLRQALARRQLEVYYQPIIDLPSGKIVKAEALLRWHHPEMGQISPEIFIPVAEDSGLLHQIGHWVFRQAISFTEQCRQRHNRLIQISVNKSPIQFEKDIYDDWPQYLSQTGLPGDSITVEITEGSLLSKSPKIKQRLLDYINFGIEVSIDDFGTGFSALSYLHQFDIDYLKIDRSFIMDLSENGAHTALTEAIIVMAHKLGIKTIAEGVENEMQRDLLRQFGCDYVQGFLYSPPVPACEFEQLLSRIWH